MSARSTSHAHRRPSLKDAASPADSSDAANGMREVAAQRRSRIGSVSHVNVTDRSDTFPFLENKRGGGGFPFLDEVDLS